MKLSSELFRAHFESVAEITVNLIRKPFFALFSSSSIPYGTADSICFAYNFFFTFRRIGLKWTKINDNVLATIVLSILINHTDISAAERTHLHIAACYMFNRID